MHSRPGHSPCITHLILGRFSTGPNGKIQARGPLILQEEIRRPAQTSKKIPQLEPCPDLKLNPHTSFASLYLLVQEKRRKIFYLVHQRFHGVSSFRSQLQHWLLWSTSPTKQAASILLAISTAFATVWSYLIYSSVCLFTVSPQWNFWLRATLSFFIEVDQSPWSAPGPGWVPVCWRERKRKWRWGEERREERRE